MAKHCAPPDGRRLLIVEGDITTQDANTVMNAANTHMLGLVETWTVPFTPLSERSLFAPVLLYLSSNNWIRVSGLETLLSSLGSK
jgi:hypothetical protein